MVKKYLGLIFLLCAILSWGPAPVFTKIALREIPEFSFAFLGRVIALIILCVIFIPQRILKIDKKDYRLMILAAFCGTVFNVGFFVFGIQLTNAMDAQAIFSAGPIISTIGAIIFLREKISLSQILGVAIGFLGALIIAARSLFESGQLQFGNLFGNFLVALSSISFVVYILLSRKLSKKYSPQNITFFSFLVSSIAFFPLALFENMQDLTWISSLTINGIFGLLYIGIFASVVAFLTYQNGIKLTNAFTAGVILYIQPIITTIVATLILGEKITPIFILGAIFIITGSFIATQYQNIKTRLGFIPK